ncbi:transposase [Candidatus Tisiphia endosymbiont of Nemotelus uliginosus]|uniref:transposase n=1 Tax=Candidatus Tisiphia endosymbiont of Nemotelus uliginosus TaxID=3077926 RepID=UPI0035C8BA9C
MTTYPRKYGNNDLSQHTLVPLPPYAPELNAMEQIWQWIKNHFLSNQCYGVYEDIVANACYAWNQLRVCRHEIVIA